MTECDRFRRLVAQRQLAELGRQVGAEADRQGLTEDELFAEIAAIRKAIFAEKYGNRTT